jgi:uncharacterized protein (DUF2147 family)
MMVRTSILTGFFVGALAMTSGVALAADPILGNWKTEEGDTAVVSQCGGSFCAVLKNGKYAGHQIGKFGGGSGSYSGKLTDPSVNKTYDGAGTVSGNSLKLKGCAMKVFCKSQTWTRL